MNSSLLRAVLFTAILIALVLFGLVLAPAWSDSHSIIASEGTFLQINHNDLTFIPFSASKVSTITGSLNANHAIEVFILSSNAGLDPYSLPSEYLFSSGPASSVVLDLSLDNGSYYLVFYCVQQAGCSSSVTVRITQTISLTANSE